MHRRLSVLAQAPRLSRYLGRISSLDPVIESVSCYANFLEEMIWKLKVHLERVPYLDAEGES